MKLGLSSYAYAWAIGIPGWPSPQTTMDAIALVRRAEALKLSVVQLADNIVPRMPQEWQTWASNALREARQSNVILELGGRGLTPQSLEAHLILARSLDARLLRFVVDGPDYHPTLTRVASIIKEALPQIARTGTVLAIENHDRFLARDLAKMVEKVDSEHVGICLDTANSLGAGEGLATVLEVLSPHTLNLHIKDVRINRHAHQLGFTVNGCAAGNGVIDISATLDSLDHYGRCRSALLELWPEPSSSPIETIEREASWVEQSIRNLRQQFPSLK